MTVSSETAKSGPYTGNGVTTVFAYGFRILDADHITVIRTENGADIEVTSGFTVSGVGDLAGGNVTFAVAPTAGQTITIIRNAPFTQQTDLENQGAYYAEVVEQAFDLAAMRDQQMAEELSRAVKVPVGRAPVDVDEAVEGLLRFADIYQGSAVSNPSARLDGSPLVAGDLYYNQIVGEYRYWDGALWAPFSTVASVVTYRYTATAGQTVFSGVDLGGKTPTSLLPGALLVHMNGIGLAEGVDFDVTGEGVSVTLTVAAALNDELVITEFQQISLSQLPGQVATDAQRAETARIGAETAADRVDLGALDAAVAATAADAVATAADAAATAADRVQTGMDRATAEAARDAAFVNAAVYASTAAGLAATSVGQQFQVVSGTEVIRYRHDAGPVATEVARYPSSAAVDEIDARVTSVSVLGADPAVAFAIVDPETGQTPFQVLADGRGSIVNSHFQEVEADATEAMEGRVKIEPTDQALSWGVVQSKANGDKAVVLGVRSTDGRIVNPSFTALWDAVFGGTVATGDLAEADTIIMHGPRIYAVEGRAIDLFGPSLLPNRNNGYRYLFGLQSVAANGMTLQQLWREHARVRCDDLGSTAMIKLINDGIAGTEFAKALSVVKSAASKSATPRVALIGDSITAGSYLKTRSRFTGYSVNPYFMGSWRTDAGIDAWMEGRGGWGAIDFTYDRTTYTPLPVGQESVALSIGTDVRNPFIRAATGGDDPAKVRNGYIFDYRFYLDRFGFADPDVVVINLSTNDINQLDWPTGYPKARDCIDIMIAQIRAACPGAIIGLAQAQKGNNSYFNPRWYNGWAPLWLHWHETYGASSDVHVLSSHAMTMDRLAVPTDTVSTNAQTGQTKEVFVSDTHPDDFVGYDAYAETIFSFIHAVS